MTVNTQKPIFFENSCECIVDVKLLEQAILWYQKRPTLPLKKIYLHGRYPAVSILNEKIHIHRLLMSHHLKRKLSRKEHVHHKNHNKLDSSLSNLDVMDAAVHISKHNKGKTLSSEHKAKIATASSNRKGIKLKRKYNMCLIELQNFLQQGHSISRVARHYGCDWGVIKQRINENPELLEVA